jgi:hypothetical protein
MRLRAWIGRAALVALLLGAGPAAAFPVVFGGPGGYGLSSSTASAVTGAGFQLIDETLVYPADDFGIVIPAPDVLSHHIQSSPSVSNPTTAQSRWSVTNGGEDGLSDAWLVFFRPTTYSPTEVGIDLVPGGQWALVEVTVGSTSYFYPAVFLGDLAADAQTTFLMNHIVGTTLTQQGSTLVLPQYQVGVLQGVLPVPEVSTLGLLFAGLVFTAALRRGKV